MAASMMTDSSSPAMIRIRELATTAVDAVNALANGEPGLAAEYLRLLQRDARTLEVELRAIHSPHANQVDLTHEETSTCPQ